MSARGVLRTMALPRARLCSSRVLLYSCAAATHLLGVMLNDAHWLLRRIPMKMKNSSSVLMTSERGLTPVAIENRRCDGVNPAMTGIGRRSRTGCGEELPEAANVEDFTTEEWEL